MAAEDWLRLREIFAAAVLVAPAERASFLNRECGDDAELRREVESLLRHDPGPDGGPRKTPGASSGHRPEAGATKPLAVGDRVGNIRIVEVLGSGGMGTVYVGFDETLQRKVALKAIGRRYRLQPEARARFLREARILSQLEHPNICRIYDYLTHGDSELLVLELIDGPTLSQAIADGLGFQQRLEIAGKIAEVLAAAHSEGIVHRDLKPDNVMLTRAGEVKVLDFGLARAVEADTGEGGSPGHDVRAMVEPPPQGGTAGAEAPLPAGSEDRTVTLPGGAPAGAVDGDLASPFPVALHTEAGSVLGTPLYMSPEQARGEAVTTASDMYSFGLVLQFLFTGESPYPGGLDGRQLLGRARRGETRPVGGIERDVAALVEQLKSLAPAARPTAVAALERLRWIRDKPRRRLRRLIAAAVVAAVVLGGLKYTLDLRRERAIAVEARNEAVLRRGQAEDLIGFMLGDLRRKLEPVGRLEILDDVGDKALDYFASLPEGSLSDDELARRSKALIQIGEVRIAQGKLDDALASFDEALTLASDLAARDPGNGDWQKDLGAVHFWIGYVAWLRGDLEAALRRYEEYLMISERLVALDPENLDWLQELAYAHTNLGAVYEARGDLDRALETIHLSNGIKRRLAAADPGNPDRARSLARGLSWLASTLLNAGRISESLEKFRAELVILRRLTRENPLDTHLRYLQSISHGHVGDLLLMSGDVQAALDHQREARTLIQDLVAHDPANLDWRRELAVSHVSTGEALLEAGSGRLAHAELEAALRLLAELVKSDPTNEDWRRELGIAHQKEAAILLAIGRPAASLDAAREALSVLDALEPDNRRAHQISQTYILLGRAHARSGRPREATTAWGRALEIVEPLGSEARSPVILDPRARALLYLGRLEEAEPIVASLTESGYARPDFVALWRERERLTKTRDRETVPQPEGSQR